MDQIKIKQRNKYAKKQDNKKERNKKQLCEETRKQGNKETKKERHKKPHACSAAMRQMQSKHTVL
jgi:hypothetical protein